MRRFFPVLVLILMAPLVAEVLPGSTPLSMPELLLTDLLIYGPGALLIRELVRRSGRGWASILLLGGAYGLIEEGLALQSLFNPEYNTVALWGARIFGVNWVYTGVNIVWIHPIWSIAIPILLTELLFPEQRAKPYLGRLGLIVVGIWYLLSAAVLGLFARSIYPYEASPMMLALVLILLVLLVVVALMILPRPKLQAKIGLKIPDPWIVSLLAGIGSFVSLAIPAFLWRLQPTFASMPLVLIPLFVPLIVAGLMIWGVRSWARASDWNDRHILALVSGMLVAHTIVGGLLFSDTITQGVIIGAMGLGMLILLILFAVYVRRRVALTH